MNFLLLINIFYYCRNTQTFYCRRLGTIIISNGQLSREQKRVAAFELDIGMLGSITQPPKFFSTSSQRVYILNARLLFS
jgi:hypothetical protein